MVKGETKEPHERPPGAELGAPSERTLVIIPTFNERENLPLIVSRVHTARPDVHILIVDDGSPDGTGELANELALADTDRVHVYAPHVEGRSRRGLPGGVRVGPQSRVLGARRDGRRRQPPARTAGSAAGRRGSWRGPGDRLALRARREVRNWPCRRMVLSRTANGYSRLLLGVDIHDITAGYRAYRREVLEKIDLAAVDSKGYCFQIDLTWRTINNGFVVVEVPITFTEREFGQSKMSGSNIREALFKVAEWGIRGRLDRARGVGVTS